MRELIYKDEAYKAIDNCYHDERDKISPADAKMNIHYLISEGIIVNALSGLDRPQGEWIITESHRKGQIIYHDYKCSICGHHRDRRMNYCEVCGARMKGVYND